MAIGGANRKKGRHRKHKQEKREMIQRPPHKASAQGWD
jgi:hypothetical protein